MSDQRRSPRARLSATSVRREVRSNPSRARNGQRTPKTCARAGPVALVDTVDYGVLHGLVGFWIRRAEVKVLRSFANHVEPVGMRPTEVAALILVGSNRGLCQIDLAAALATDQSTVVNLLSGLERRNLISRIRDIEDRRYHVLSLTQEGRTTLRRIKAALARHNDAIQAGLSDRDKVTLIAALRQFVEA